MGLKNVYFSKTKNRVDILTLGINLSSEIAELKEILDILPAENVLERRGFEERLSSAQKQLESLEENI